MADVKVLGVGSPILDVLVSVDDDFIVGVSGEKGGMELVGPDELDEILSRTTATQVKAPGGSAGNTIVGLAQLGMETAFLGKLGKDDDGNYYRNGYADLGIDCSRFCEAEGIHTGRCLSMVTPDSERTMRTDLGAAALLSEDDITPACFSGITHVHLEGYMLFAGDLTRKVMSLAKEAGCTISLDLASFEVVRVVKDMLPGLLSEYVDILFANEVEAAELCGDVAPEVACEMMTEYCETVAVKVGPDGAFIRHGGEVIRIAAEKVDAIDTTGAGDLWQAGFIYGGLSGKLLEKAGGFGSILGAEVVQVMGAAIPEERWQVIRSRIQ